MKTSAPGLRCARLEGEQYDLLPFTEELISERYIGWLNNPEVNQFLEVRFQTQTQETVRSFVRSFYQETEKYMWGIFPKGEVEPVGTATLQSISRHHGGSGEIGLMIGKKDYWGRGASMEAMKLVMRFGFMELGLRRFTGGCYAPNSGMSFTFKRLGFRLEGKLVKAFAVSSGQYVDGYRWGILREEWDPLNATNI